MDYWEGQRVCLPPSQIIGGGGGLWGAGPLLPTPMKSYETIDALYEIWLRLAQWLLSGRLNMGDLAPRL